MIPHYFTPSSTLSWTVPPSFTPPSHDVFESVRAAQVDQDCPSFFFSWLSALWTPPSSCLLLLTVHVVSPLNGISSLCLRLFSHHIFVLLSLRVIFPVYLRSSSPAPFSFFYDLFSLTLLTHSLTFYVSYIKLYSYTHMIKLWQIGKAIYSRERTVQWYGRDEIGRGINWYALWVNLLSHIKYVVILICFVL